MITSVSNKKVKEVQALNRKASYRRECGLYTVEGIRMFREIPESLAEQVFVSESFYAKCGDETRQRIESLPHEFVTDAVSAAMSDTKTPQGILVLVKRQGKALEDLLNLPEQCFLVLESIQDPGNLGTMLRAGEGAGLTGIVADRGTADIYNPKVIRSTMGSIFRVPVVYTDDLRGAVRRMKQHGIRTFAAHLKGTLSYDMESYLGPSAFLIGNEAAGLTEETAEMADTLVKIPMLGKVESLNAAVAASVLMFELSRQRRNSKAEQGGSTE
ncbi:MAG: RNA methyltransferase [Stomatobaculum sp.]|nr:RNA methyltransferase [Stomatobaculum sp.]